MDYAGTGDAHVDHAVALAHAVERAGHKGVILDCVAEDHQLGAAETGLAGGELGALLDDAAHDAHGVHVDARLGGAHVDRGADILRAGQGLGDGGDEFPVGGGGALLHQGGEAADEVDAGSLGRIVHGNGEGDVVLGLGGPGHQGHGRDRDALVHNGNAILPLNILAGGDETVGIAGDLIIDLPAGGFGIGIGAVQKGDPHGDGAYVQVLLVDHVDGVQDFVGIDHVPGSLLKCGAWR